MYLNDLIYRAKIAIKGRGVEIDTSANKGKNIDNLIILLRIRNHGVKT